MPLNHNLSAGQFGDLDRQLGEGGFSVHAMTGQPAPSPGYMVGQRGREERYGPDHPRPYSPAVLEPYVQKHLGDLSHPEAYFGGWPTGRNVALDVSHRVQGFVPAHRAMVFHGQEAMYDLEGGHEIPNYMHPKTREKLHRAAAPAVAALRARNQQ